MTTPLLTAAAMRAADRATIETIGVPGFTLMESAGRAASAAVERRFGPAEKLHLRVFCGKGNNGGDGLVVARTLFAGGATVEVVLLGTEEELTPDAALNLRLLRYIEREAGDGRLTLSTLESPDALGDPPPADLHVDALLGTGISSAPRGLVADVVTWLNRRPEPVVSLDVPTGLDSDTGKAHDPSVRAACTVTMAAPKVGLYVNGGLTHAGSVETVEIGIPPFVLAKAAERPGCAFLTNERAVASSLPVRAPDTHKYRVGYALVVAGSSGYTGAAVLASLAAERSGAGYVVCACPSGVQPVLATKLTTVMTLGLPQTDAGTIAEEAVGLVLERGARAGALLVGCGLGRDPSTIAFVRDLLRASATPVVVDADGLFALAGATEWLAETSNGQWILTPHWGEFIRLAGRDDLDPIDRVALAQEFARAWNCVLVLKGQPSVVSTPSGRTYVCGTGNAALATAGTGDVLAGLCVGFRAQGMGAEAAAVAALHLGGAAADVYASRQAGPTMTALDLVEQLPDAMTRLCRPATR